MKDSVRDKTDPQSEDESDVQRRFHETLGRLVNTPHKPHAPLRKGREPKPAPKS